MRDGLSDLVVTAPASASASHCVAIRNEISSAPMPGMAGTIRPARCRWRWRRLRSEKNCPAGQMFLPALDCARGEDVRPQRPHTPAQSLCRVLAASMIFYAAALDMLGGGARDMSTRQRRAEHAKVTPHLMTSCLAAVFLACGKNRPFRIFPKSAPLPPLGVDDCARKGGLGVRLEACNGAEARAGPTARPCLPRTGVSLRMAPAMFKRGPPTIIYAEERSRQRFLLPSAFDPQDRANPARSTLSRRSTDGRAPCNGDLGGALSNWSPIFRRHGGGRRCGSRAPSVWKNPLEIELPLINKINHFQELI
jgi:hypothetical protein